MNCSFEACRRPISKADEPKRVEWRTGNDKGKFTFRVYGRGMPDGPLSEAVGTLVMVFHHKCHFAHKRRQALLEAKAADPSAQPGRATDWREQETAEVEDLIGEGHRDNRGAGAQGH